MAKKTSTGKTIFKIACATGGAVLASGVGLPWLGAMAGSCLPKVLEGSLNFLVSAVEDDKKQEVLASLLQKPIEQLASLGIEFAGGRIDDFFKSHFEAKESELNFDLPRAVVKVWEEALNKMLRAERDTSTLGLNRDDDFEKARKELLTFWRQKLHKAQSDNDLLKEFFGEKPDYFLDIEKGKMSFIDALPDQEQVEIFFWNRIEDSFTNWAKKEEKFPEDWTNSIHQNLKVELKQKLFHNFSSALKKELKENERAWKSFEFASSLQTVSMLQSLASNTDQIKDDTNNIKNDLAELNTVLPLIMPSINALENTAKEYFKSNQKIIEFLNDFGKDITDKLSEIAQTTQRTEGKVDEIGKDLKTLLGEKTETEAPKISKDIESIIDKGWDLIGAGKYEGAKAQFQKALETSIKQKHSFAVAKVKYSQAAFLIDYQRNTLAAKPLLEECLEEFKKVNSEVDVASALRQLGLIEITNVKIDRAKAYTSQALTIFEKKENKTGISDCLRQMGWIAHAEGKYKQSVDFYDKAIAISLELEQSGDSKRRKGEAQSVAACYAHKGMVLEAQGNVAESEAAFMLSLEWHKKAGVKSETAKLLLRLAELKSHDSKFEKAIEYLNEAANIYSEIEDYRWLAKCLDLMSRIHVSEGEEDKATALLEVALEVVEKYEDFEQQEKYLHKLGQLSLRVGKDEDGKQYFEKAKCLSLSEGMLDGYAAAVSGLAKIAEKESNKQERDRLLIDGVGALEKILVSTQREPERAGIMGRIASFYVRMEDFQEALNYFQKERKAWESMSNIHGVADALGGIAWMKHKLGKPNEAFDIYREMKGLVDGSSHYDLIAGSAMNLANFEMQQGNLNEAKRLLDEAEFYCRKYKLSFLKGVFLNQEILATEFKKAKVPELDLSELLTDLFSFIDSYPESRESLFRLWFHDKAGDLYSNYRNLSGVKLLICQDDVDLFLKASMMLSHYVDLSLEAVGSKFPGTITEWFKYPTDRHFPVFFSFGFLPKDTPKDVIPTIPFSKLETRYFALPQEPNPRSEITGKEGVWTFGWSIGLPEQAHQLILSSTAEDLIEQKVFFLPFERHLANDDLLSVLRVSKDNGLVSVYFDSLPTSENVRALHSAKINLPILSADDAESERKRVRKVKQAVMQLLSVTKNSARVAPALSGYAMRIVPEPAEQLVRLAAREALDVAVGSVVDEALELYRGDVDRIAHTLEPSRDLRTRCEQLLAEGNLPGVLDAIAQCGEGQGGAPPSRETMRLAQRVLEGAIELLQRAGAPLIAGVRGGGRGACRVLVAAPLVSGVRRGGRVPWIAGRLPPLELDWRRDDYDQIFSRVAPQLHPLATQVRRLLVPRRRLGRKSGYPSGQRADLRRLMRCEADPRRHDEIWERKTIPARHATEFLLLVDLSGSMRGAKTEAALAGTVLFAEMLSSLSVGFAVVGFQDVLIPLLDFDQPFSVAARRRLLEIRAEVAAARTGGNNRPDYNDDGPCLREAAAILLARAASDRVLIAISDGLPEGHRSTAADLRNAVVELSMERSLTLVGVGLGADTSHVADYYPHALASVPLERFAEEIGRLLEGLLAR